MAELQDRLLHCFSSVFPTIPLAQLRLATVQTMPEWDSIAAVTLVAVLQEEFAIRIDFSELPRLGSFEAVQRYLDSVGISDNGHK